MTRARAPRHAPDGAAPRGAGPRASRRASSPEARTEAILEALRTAGRPLRAEELGWQLGLSARASRALAPAIAALEAQGLLLRNRKGALCAAEKLDLTTGVVQGHPDGFGFLVPDAGGPDLFLSPREMRKALHGDRVAARRVGTDRRGRPEGAIVEVLRGAPRRVVGRLRSERGAWFVVAEDRRVSQELLVPAEALGGAREEQVVLAEVVEPPSEHTRPVAKVVEVLGAHSDPGMEIEIALRKHELPFAFPAAVERRAARVPEGVLPRERAGRLDLRELPLVTIDGETARDFDDAVWCAREARGFRLVVAIADVSHYVHHGDPLDEEARLRGNSVYFPRRVIPMLPEALSNGLCSLNPEVERLCVACDLRIGPRGAVTGYAFHPAVMRSRARLTYTEVARWLADPDAARGDGRAAPLLPHLQALESVWRVLAAARARRGAIDFDSVETELDFDAHGKIRAIRPAPRNDAHRLIEECMLAANVSAADLLLRHRHPALFRVHEGPTPEKLAALREFLDGFGLSLGGGEEPAAQDYARLIARIRDRADAPLLQTVLLRSLKQAAYSPANVGHFGLAYPAYVHFTSPIRRYPDLLVHRAIKAVLDGGTYAAGDLVALGGHCSETERRADDASREVVNWLKCYFLRDRVGETFRGTVSAITHFGAFVTLDEVFADGLLHVSELGPDYFHFDPVRHWLRGERTGRTFRLADRIEVRLARVDLDESRLEFVLPEASAGGARTRRRGARRL